MTSHPTHVHPETYEETDNFEHRRYQLHQAGNTGLCEATWCTFGDLTPDAQAANIAQAKRLQAEKRLRLATANEMTVKRLRTMAPSAIAKLNDTNLVAAFHIADDNYNRAVWAQPYSRRTVAGWARRQTAAVEEMKARKIDFEYGCYTPAGSFD